MNKFVGIVLAVGIGLYGLLQMADSHVIMGGGLVVVGIIVGIGALATR